MNPNRCLTEKDAFLKILSFEQNHRPYNFIVNDIHVWQIVRSQVMGKIQNLSWNKPSIPRFEIVSAILRGLMLWKVFNLRKKRFVVQSLYSGLRLSTNHKIKDIWFGDFLENNSSSAVLTRLNAPGFSGRIHKSEFKIGYDNTLFYFIASVLSRLLPIRKHDEIFEDLALLIQNNLEAYQFSSSFIRKKVSHFFWLSKCHELFLAITRPEYVLVVDTDELAFLYACKKRNIKFVEFQHGIFTRHHPRSIPGDTSEIFRHLLCPDIFAVYGEFWKEELSGTMLGKRDVLRVIGNGQLEKYQLIRKELYQSNGKIKMVITTQPFDQNELKFFLKELISLCKIDFELCVKLHPASGKNLGPLQELISHDKRITFQSAFEGPNTYELIAECDFHLSVSSACHFDALAIGTPTIVLGLDGYVLMESMINAGYMILVKTPQQLIDIVFNQKPQHLFKADYFCKPGFAKNCVEIFK